MKRKLQALSTEDLRNEFNIYFNTTHLSNDLMDMLPERKQRSYIIKQMLKELSITVIKGIVKDF